MNVCVSFTFVTFCSRVGSRALTSAFAMLSRKRDIQTRLHLQANRPQFKLAAITSKTFSKLVGCIYSCNLSPVYYTPHERSCCVGGCFGRLHFGLGLHIFTFERMDLSFHDVLYSRIQHSVCATCQIALCNNSDSSTSDSPLPRSPPPHTHTPPHAHSHFTNSVCA